MKKLLYILLLISSAATAQVKVGADGAIHATGSYPPTLMREAKAYALSVQSITDRNTIPSNFRDTGMLILVRDSSCIYTLVGGITNSDWVKFGVGSNASGAILSVTVDETLSSDSTIKTIPIPTGITGFKKLDVTHTDETVSGYLTSWNDTNIVLEWQVANIGTFEFILIFYF